MTQEVVGPHRERAVAVSSREQLLASKALLKAFTTTYPEWRACHGDDSTTTMCSCGLVLLAMASSSRISAEIAEVTGFNEDFVDTVIEVMDEASLWHEERFLDLVATVATQGNDLLQVRYAVESTLEGFWRLPSSTEVWLEITRARRLFGGQVQSWIDRDFRDENLVREKPWPPIGNQG